MAGKALPALLHELEAMYGRPKRIPPKGPFELVLWENIAYLVNDERRRAAFEALGATVGLKPRDILDASDEALLAVTKLGGMHPERRIQTLRDIAARVESEHGGELERILTLSPKAAMRELRKFPSIGEPGAETILLRCGVYPVLGLESNGLRVLVRLGYGKEAKSYSTTYRSVRDAIEPELTRRTAWLVRARDLLRRHGQETCKTTAPRCELCPIRDDCRYVRR